MSYSKRAWEEMMAAQYGDEPLDWPIDADFFLGDAAEPRVLLEGEAGSARWCSECERNHTPENDCHFRHTRSTALSASEAPPAVNEESLSVYRRSAGIVEDTE